MIRLPETTNAAASQRQAILKRELESLQSGSLPLQACTNQGGLVDDSNISVTVLALREQEGGLYARLGIFFTEVVGGCNCHDDPLEVNAYAEIELNIDAETAEMKVL